MRASRLAGADQRSRERVLRPGRPVRACRSLRLAGRYRCAAACAPGATARPCGDRPAYVSLARSSGTLGAHCFSNGGHDLGSESGELITGAAAAEHEAVHAVLDREFGEERNELCGGCLAVEVVDPPDRGGVTSGCVGGLVDAGVRLGHCLAGVEVAHRGQPAVCGRADECESPGLVDTEPDADVVGGSGPGMHTAEGVRLARRPHRALVAPHQADYLDGLTQRVDRFTGATARAPHGCDGIPERTRPEPEFDAPAGE